MFLFMISLGRYEYKMPRRNFADFNVYYFTAQKLAVKANIYDAEAYSKEKVANFKYPPIAALVFYPLGYLSENHAAILWFSVNYILILLFFRYAAFLIFDEEFENRKRNWVYFLTCLFTLRFFLLNFDEGQANILMMASLTFGLYMLTKGKVFISALFLSFSYFLKYMSVVFVPYFLYKRKIKFVLLVLLSLFLFLLVPAFFFGWDYNLFLQKSFLPFVFKTSTDIGSMQDYQNMSLMAMLLRHFSRISYFNINSTGLNWPQVKIVFFVFVSFLYMLILLKPAKVFKNIRFLECINFGMLFLSMALLNPHAWKHAFIFLLFPYMVCLYYLFKTNNRDVFVWFLTVLSFMLNNWPDKLFISSVYHSTGIYSFITFGTLMLYCALCKIKFSPINKGGFING